MSTHESSDVADILADLRGQIRLRRAQLAIHGAGDPHALGLAELRRGMESVNELWFVSPHLPINWRVRIFGRLLAYAKRAIRLLLRWYINPIVEQQNRFNAAVARAITLAGAYQEQLTREWVLLEERAARLEKEIGGRAHPGPERPERG